MEVRNIFIVEDDKLFAKVFEKRLRERGSFAVHLFESVERAMSNLMVIKPEIIFLDHHLKGVNGVDALPIFKEKLPDSDIAIVSSQREVAVLAEALDSGASKYFFKDALLVENADAFINEIISKSSGFRSFWNKLMNND